MKNIPRHTIERKLYMCMDSRKESCPFYRTIIIDDEFVSFSQRFCSYPFRKNEKNPSCDANSFSSYQIERRKLNEPT